MELFAQLAGALVTTSCVALVVLRAATAPAPPPLPRATEAQRATFAATVSSLEGEWRDKAAEDFPEDNWSQRDAFHGHEANTVRDLAAGAGLSYEDVLGAIDADIHHDRGSERNANAVPCKPRPIFD